MDVHEIGLKQIPNTNSEHLPMVQSVGNDYFESPFFHLTYFNSCYLKNAILIGIFLVNCDERFG
jgi:hypothetical protein